jgi:hypothetical protein
MALDWRVIQDQLGVQALPMRYWPEKTPLYHSFQYKLGESRRAEVLFEDGFESTTLGEFIGHPGVKIVEDPDGEGRSIQFSTAEFRHKERISIEPGHWIVISWKSRTMPPIDRTLPWPGEASARPAYLEIDYQDTDGKVVEPNPVPVRPDGTLPLGATIRDASGGKVGEGWTEHFWSLELPWGSRSRTVTTLPPEARSIGLRFFHNSVDQSVTLIDDIRVIDAHPAAMRIVADTIAEHRRLLAKAVETIRGLPDSPETAGWKRVVADHGDKIATQLSGLAGQDPTSEEFIRDSDPPLLFARRLADAAEALKTGRVHPETILTYSTRPVPAIGPFSFHDRLDPVGVLPYATEIEGKLAKEAAIQACPGEFEPISIAMWSPKDVKQITVRAEDLTGPDGAIPAENLDIKVVKWWRTADRRAGWHGYIAPKFLVNDDGLIKVDLKTQRNYLKLSFPDGARYAEPPHYDVKVVGETDIEEDFEKFPLRDSDVLQPFDLVGGQNKQIWVTVKVPDDVAPGDYSGDLVFKADDREVARVALVLQVLPFTLPDPKTRYDLTQDYVFSIYYRGRLNEKNEGKIGFTTKNEQQFRAELKMMYDHGIVTPLMLLSGHLPGGIRPKPLFRKHLEIMREIGMSGRPLYLGENCGLRDFDRLREYVREVQASASDFGFTDVYFYGQDEAVGKVIFDQVPSLRVVKELGAKVQVAFLYQWVDKAPEEFDTVIAFGHPHKAWAEGRHRIGGKITSYAYPHSSNPDPLMYRRKCGLVGWMNNYDGSTLYGFQHNYRGVWNDLDGFDYNIAYPTTNGAVGTLALEALREGSDDVRYATMLMMKIKEARESGVPEAKRIAGEAARWIDGLDFLLADLDEARAKMIETIKSLSEAL